jgi:serine/threonine protein kinase
MKNENNTQFIAQRSATQTPIPPTPADNQGKGQPLLHTGEKLGNYRLMRLLARGGFADVYLGEHIHLGTEAAIKVLRARLSSKDLLTFREEARIVARLHHSHIVTIFDFDVQNGIPFIVMDYAPNGTLRQRHPKGSVLAPATIIPYLKQVADALQHGHDQQVIHRDVKPENMLIGRKNDILLSDFGIATMLQNAHPTANQKIIGTATYMSPEQFQGHAFPASDQYSLAVIAYEWLAGECPFTGSVSQIAAQHMQDPPPSLCKRNPQISPVLEQVVFRALAKYPAQRFASVAEFADAFADASPQQVLVLRGPGRSPRQPIAPANNDQTTFIPLGQAQQNYTQVAPPPQQQPGGGVSRRAVVVGLAGLATVGVAGAAAWAVSRAGFFSPNANNQAATQATRTPAPSPTAPTTGKLLTTYTKHEDDVTAVAWMPGNSGIVASGSKDKTVRVWRSNGGIDIHNYTGHEDVIDAIAWSPDGQFIASASNDNTVHVWTAQQDELDITYNRHERDVRSVAWSRDSQLIASGSRDATVRLWHAQSGDDVGVFNHTDQVWAVAWSSDGRYIASAGDDRTIYIWNPTELTNQDNGNGNRGNSKHNKNINNQAIIASFEGSEDSVRTLAWSPNNTQLASGGEDNTVRIWALTGGNTPTVIYRQHSGTVLAVAWSPDGQKIASASADGTVHIWKASDGSDLYVYKGHNGNEVNTVAWSADGKYLASGSADKTVQIWSA